MFWFWNKKRACFYDYIHIYRCVCFIKCCVGSCFAHEYWPSPNNLCETLTYRFSIYHKLIRNAEKKSCQGHTSRRSWTWIQATDLDTDKRRERERQKEKKEEIANWPKQIKSSKVQFTSMTILCPNRMRDDKWFAHTIKSTAEAISVRALDSHRLQSTWFANFFFVCAKTFHYIIGSGNLQFIFPH